MKKEKMTKKLSLNLKQAQEGFGGSFRTSMKFNELSMNFNI